MANIGCRIYTKINRPSKELVEKFRDMPIANIADCMGRISCMDQGIKNANTAKLLGTAFTVKAPAGDNLMVHRALDMLEPGDILVIDGNGDMERSQVGEMMISYAKARGCAGVIVDGVVRDLHGLQKLGIPVYSRGYQANGPYKNGPGEINVPVPCGGVVVFPGDILVGDLDGVVVIHPEDAEDLAVKAQKVWDMEQRMLPELLKGNWDRTPFHNALEKLGYDLIQTTWDGK